MDGGALALQRKEGPAPGRRTQAERVYGGLQRRGDGAPAATEPEAMTDAAARGMSGSRGDLPHGEAIQRAFGAHDVSDVSAHVGGAAADACDEIGAAAYALDGAVAFAGPPDLHTSAHEAAHVVQQRAGVQLLGGIGEEGDAYEQHADLVADAVVRGESAEGLLDAMPGGGAAGARAVQRRITRPTPLQLRGKGGGGGGTPAAEQSGGASSGDTPASGGADHAAPPRQGTDKVARLYFLVDVDVKSLGLKDLQEGSVGHTWISLEYIDPHAVPESIQANHRELLSHGGRYADPMGFWPDIENDVYYSTNPFNSYVQGWMRHPDRAHQGAEKAVQMWELTQAEVEAVIAYAESKRGAKYSVYFFNCTTFAREATAAAGKSAPSASTAGICFPNAAYDGIMKRQANNEGHTFVTNLDSGETTETIGTSDAETD